MGVALDTMFLVQMDNSFIEPEQLHLCVIYHDIQITLGLGLAKKSRRQNEFTTK
jgi:hypothetical protein